MKSSCSARGLSVSQNLPEIALIPSVSLSSDTLSFRLSLYSSWSTHPHTHSLFISPYWSRFSCLLLPRLLPPRPLQILSLHQSVSSPAVCHQYESTQLICNRHDFCQHLVFLMSQFLSYYRVILEMYRITFCSCLSVLFTPLCSPQSHQLTLTNLLTPVSNIPFIPLLSIIIVLSYTACGCMYRNRTLWFTNPQGE